MTKSKKQVPLEVLSILEQFLLIPMEKCQIIEPENFLIKIKDNDRNSDFYYNIVQHNLENGILKLLVDLKPQDRTTINNKESWIDARSLSSHFNTWLSILEGYDSVKTVYDDPIEQKYQEEFYSEFEIIDDDAAVNGFSLTQQMWLDSYLTNVIHVLDQHISNESDETINEIKEDVKVLRNNLTKLTKQRVIQALSKIWAKVRKHGLQLLKEIYIEAKSELIKQLIEIQIGRLK